MSQPASRGVLARLILLLAAASQGACEGDFTVDVAAAPRSDVQRLVIAVPSVDLLDGDGGVTNLGSGGDDAFDLLQYVGGERKRLIESESAEDASYIGIRPRFDTDEAYVVLGNGTHVPVELLSQGDYASLSFDVGENTSAAIVVEIDPRFSLIDYVATHGYYYLLPVARAVNADTAGAIEGSIAASILNDDDCRAGRSTGAGVAVYLYGGAGVTPTDYVGGGSVVAVDPPIASADAYDEDGLWHYRFAWVAPGSYTVSLTCEADAENPTAYDGLYFRSSLDVNVAELATATADFAE